MTKNIVSIIHFHYGCKFQSSGLIILRIFDKSDMKLLGLAASRIAISGNHMLRRPKHSKIEVVVPKEEEKEDMKLFIMVVSLASCYTICQVQMLS
jgi:hypothetical protein